MRTCNRLGNRREGSIHLSVELYATVRMHCNLIIDSFPVSDKSML